MTFTLPPCLCHEPEVRLECSENWINIVVEPGYTAWHQGWGKWATPGTIECFTVVCDQTQEKIHHL